MCDIMLISGVTDCHTSDIGHWFAMTETDFVDNGEPVREDRVLLFSEVA